MITQLFLFLDLVFIIYSLAVFGLSLCLRLSSQSEKSAIFPCDEFFSSL